MAPRPFQRRERESLNMLSPCRSLKFSSQGSEAMALFMNSANLPHLNNLLSEQKEKERKRVAKIMSGLLSMPRWTGASVQLKFRGLKIDDRAKMQIWKQHGIILSQLNSITDVEYGPKDVYIFLQVKTQGPLLYHIYVWLGIKIHGSALELAFKHAQNLAHCLPGKPVIHKEFYGYETYEFHQMLGTGAKYLKSHHMTVSNYLSYDIGECILIEYNHASESLERVDNSILSYKYLISCKNPLLMNTPTCIYLWVPESYWAEQLKGQQQLALVITELFITKCSHPKWTPVIVMTHSAEEWMFCNLFRDWEWSDLTLSPKASKLRLPLLRTPVVAYPATGQLKSWILEGEMFEKVPLNKLGHFYTDKVQLVYYTYQKQSSLYTWLEGMLYVWIGAKVKTDREKIVQEALKQTEVIGLLQKIPLTIVPEGKEPAQLLHLFRGKFVIHTKHSELTACRLYKLAGSGAMTMKATEVPAKASSLHSSHSFFLLEEGGTSYVWAGQFSEKTLRRGALVVAKMLTESSEVHKLAEGLEPPAFWILLGGQGKHEHFSPNPTAPYTPPMLFSVSVIKNTPSFLQHPAMKKEALLSTTCYFLAYKDQILLRLGKDWKEQVSPSKIAEEYILQYCGLKRETDFVVTVVYEDSEGEMFWKWFKLQDSNTAHDTSSAEPGDKSNMEVEDIEEVDFGTVMVNYDEYDTCPVTAEVEGESSQQGATLVSKESQHDVSLADAPSTELQLESLDTAQENLEQREGEVFSERAGETADILTSMISGLEDILGSPELLAGEESTASVQVAEVGEPVLTPTKQMKGAEGEKDIRPLERKEDQKPLATKNVTPRKSVDKGPKVYIKVKVEELEKEVELQVRVLTTVINVIFRVAEASDLRLKDNYALYEVSESLKIERALEDHELIGSVLDQWPAKNKPAFLLKQFPTKNDLWTKHTSIPKQAVTLFTKKGIVPSVSGKLHHCKKGGSKLKWKQEDFIVRESGIFSVAEHSSKETLSCGLDHLLYTPSTVTGKGMDTPTPNCFIMKHPTSWKDRGMKLYCAQDVGSYAQWVHSVRLLKHGIQLKGNFVAMKNRLEKVKEKELLKEAVTSASPST